MRLKRVVHKTKSFAEAEWWDIQQQIHMTPEERQKASKALKIRVFGKTSQDVREGLRKTK